MKGLVYFILVVLMAGQTSAMSEDQSEIEELKLQCRKPGNPTSLIISMIQPTDENDCEPNDDCNQTSGWFVLKTDLSNPNNPNELDSENDSFTEKELNGLKIEQFGNFTIELDRGFRDDIESGGATTATVTSLVAEGEVNGEIQLRCTR